MSRSRGVGMIFVMGGGGGHSNCFWRFAPQPVFFGV